MKPTRGDDQVRRLAERLWEQHGHPGQHCEMGTAEDPRVCVLAPRKHVVGVCCDDSGVVAERLGTGLTTCGPTRHRWLSRGTVGCPGWQCIECLVMTETNPNESHVPRDAHMTRPDDDGSVVANDREEAREARRHADAYEPPQHRHGCRRDETCRCEGE